MTEQSRATGAAELLELADKIEAVSTMGAYIMESREAATIAAALRLAAAPDREPVAGKCTFPDCTCVVRPPCPHYSHSPAAFPSERRETPDRCTCGADPDQPPDHHDISCPAALTKPESEG